MDFPKVSGETEPDHIGDGVYATYDGYHVWLRTYRDGRWESVALDPYTFDNLLRYRSNVTRKDGDS